MCNWRPIENVAVKTDLENRAVVLEIDTDVWRFGPAEARVVAMALMKCAETLEKPTTRPAWKETDARPS